MEILLMSCQEKIKTTQGKIIAQTYSPVKVHIDIFTDDNTNVLL